MNGTNLNQSTKTLEKLNNINPRIRPIIDSLDKASDLKDEDINEITEQVEFLINLKRKKKSH
ncbi:hypothetical protein [Clostridium sp. HBUAS56017]|uniref:hypothetical protein n=1 Tax=Clostridium sp. HBUAS56017 TaxID=2571128 RepID=UPI00117868E7|nr:hypothetical protein [Clostridium sp. HBUAS56017]